MKTRTNEDAFKPKLLIDGDVFRYRIGFAGEHMHYQVVDGTDAENPQFLEFSSYDDYRKWAKEQGWSIARGGVPQPPDGFEVDSRLIVEPLENVLHVAKAVLGTWDRKYPGHERRVFFSCPTPENWRTTVYPEYKAGRPERKPVHAHEVEQYLCAWADYWYREKHMEADDSLVVEAAHARREGIDYVIISYDKDLLQIPGKHYNWKDEEERIVDEDEAERILAAQCISGDRVDNIPGLPGIGEKTAMKAVAGLSGDAVVWGKVEELYHNHYCGCKEDRCQNDVWYYHYLLNKALVTLPDELFTIPETIDAIEYYEKKASQQLSQEGEGAGETDGRSGRAPAGVRETPTHGRDSLGGDAQGPEGTQEAGEGGTER